MFRDRVQRLCVDVRGATAVEYGLILALMTIAIIGAISAVGAGTAENFNEAANSIIV